VPNFETPVCFVNEGDPQELVNRMLAYLTKITDDAYTILQSDFEHIYDQLKKADEDD
jgi:hypothetical protein